MFDLEKELKLENNKNTDFFIKQMDKKQIVVAKVLNFDSINNLIVCMLSDKVSATLPISEVVPTELKYRYNEKNNSYFYPEVASLVGSNISAIITSYNPVDNSFIISRRDAILKTFDEIKTKEFLYCSIKSISNSHMFLDCGCGVLGTLYVGEASECRIKNLKDSFLEKDTIRCKIIGVDENNKRLILSRKQAIPSECIKFNENDIVYGKVRDTFFDSNDSLGQKSFFFEILPYNICGILNTFYYDGDLRYNDSLICTVTRVNHDNKYKLQILKRL